jgi:hypothetical protein
MPGEKYPFVFQRISLIQIVRGMPLSLEFAKFVTCFLFLGGGGVVVIHFILCGRSGLQEDDLLF